MILGFIDYSCAGKRQYWIINTLNMSEKEFTVSALFLTGCFFIINMDTLSFSVFELLDISR